MNKKYIIYEAEVKYKKTKLKYVPKLTSPENIFSWYKELSSGLQEKFIVIYMNSQNEIICSNVEFTGDLNCSAVYVKPIMRNALLFGAVALIFCHNHPSGNPEPSSDDKEITKKFQTAGEAIDIKILDHVIIGEGKYYSFAEEGIL